MNVITIEGDRQSGKTEMAIDVMIRRAQAGDSVAYVAREVVRSETHRRVEQRGGYELSSRAHGNCRVTYPSGGRILFLSSQADSGRGLALDAVVMDGGTAENAKLVDAYAAAMAAATHPTFVKVLTRP